MIGEVSTPLSLVSTIAYKPGASIQDYYDAQGFSKSTRVICVLDGEPVLRKRWNRYVARSERIAFYIVPAGRTFKSILAVAAQIAAFVVLTPLIGPVGAAAVSAAIGAVFNILLTPKTPGQTKTEASPTYSTDAQGNQARLLSPIPRGYGRHMMFPDFAAQPYTSFENNEQYLYQLFCCGVGEYDIQQVRISETAVWSSVTGYSSSFDDVQIEIVPPGKKVTLFPTAVQTSSLVGGADMLANDVMGPYEVNAANTKINRINFDFVFPSGLFQIDDKGRMKNQSVTIRVEYRLIDDTGTPAGAWTLAGSPTYSRATATAQRFTESFPVTEGRYQARATRITADAIDNTKFSDKVQWAGLRGFQPGTEVHPDVTLLAVKIKATNQLSQQSSRQFNVIQTSKLPIWDGATWSAPQPTRSIAWIVADMLRNPIYGEGRTDALIDLDKLLLLDETWKARGDTFNGVFDTKRTFWDALGSVLSAGRAQPMLVAGVCTFMRDEPRTLPKGVFTPSNIQRNSFSTEHILYDDGTADDVIVEFQDERTWKQTEVQCSLPGSKSTNPARITLFGVTSRTQAWREGMYHAACNMYRRVSSSLSTEMEGKLLVRGDAAQVSHDMPKWGASGYIEAYDAPSRSIYLSEPMPWENGPFNIALADRKGRYWGPVTVTRGLSDDIAVINAVSLQAIEAAQSPLSSVIVTDPNKVQTRFMFGSTTIYSKRFLITGTRPRSMDSVEVGLINDDPRVYVADTGNPPAEAEPNGPGANPDAPRVTGLKVSLDPSTDTSAALIRASWLATPGATNYVAQSSLDGQSWETVYEGQNISTSFVAQANTLYFRVAAIGLLRGPWNTQVRNFTNPAFAPSPVAGVNISVTNGQSLINCDWQATFRATKYLVEIVPLEDTYTPPAGEQPYVPDSFGPNGPQRPYRPGGIYSNNVSQE
jgi:hypothetical protein